MSKESGSQTIYSVISNHADTQPDSTALMGISRNPLSYKGLLEQIDYTRIFLQENAVNNCETVSIVLENGPEMAVSFISVASWVTCAPLNPGYREEEFRFFLTDLAPKALIVDADKQNPVITVAEELGIKVFYLKRRNENAGAYSLTCNEKTEEESVLSIPETDDIALILHTSGTTSRPKMVPLTQSNLCTSAMNISGTLRLVEDDRCLNVMPLFHIHGLVGALLSSMIVGASVICTAGYRNTEFFSWLKEYSPTWYSAVPTIHHSVLERIEQSPDKIMNSSLRFIRSSSSALPPQLMKGLEDAVNVPVIESYGMTEASHQMASNLLPPNKRKPGSVGVAAGPQIAVMDGEGNILPPGAIGEVVIRGANVTRGYLNNEEANESSFTNGWFRTGDEGYFDEEGYLYLTDRIKEIINRGGEKVSPREIDEVVLDHPSVRQAVTFAVPDPRLGEEVGIAVVLEKDHEVSVWDIQRHVSRRLIDFKVPRHVVFLDEIPKGPTGKLQRIGLAERLDVKLLNEYELAEKSAYKAPSSKLEHDLVRIWSHVLDVKVGVSDNYFHLGGDSLKAEEIVSRISKLLNIKQLPLVIFLQAPTIQAMAELLQRETVETPVIIEMQDEGEKHPLYLIHACTGEVLFFTDLVQRLDKTRPVYALRAPGLEGGPIGYSSLEELASIYVRSIRETQKQGPYVIGGAGIGGLIGLEIAIQLGDIGESVAPLILFDTIPPKQAVKKPVRSLLESIRYYVSRVRFYWENEQVLALSRALFKMRYWNYAKQHDPRLMIRVHNIHTASKYATKRYDGEVLLFMSDKRLGYVNDPSIRIALWDGLLNGPMEVHVIHGVHTEILREPYVEKLASILKEYLRNVK